MAHTYSVTVPYCCGVTATVVTDEPIKGRNEAFGAFMDLMDEKEIRIAFLDKDGKEVDGVEIFDGSYLKEVSSGNVIHAPCHGVDWQEER